MTERKGTPFNATEFQHVLGELRDGKCRTPDYTLFCIAEQIEANRLAIEELSRKYTRLGCDQAFNPGIHG
jgi:hypothetical protein